MSDKIKNIKPDIEGETEELARISQDLKREEGIELSVDKLVDAFENSEEETLTDNIWVKLENTESNEIEKGDWEGVMSIAKRYGKTNPKKLKQLIIRDKYERPLIVKIGNRYILVAGNTRLCTAAAMGINPKVYIANIDVDSELNEKWSEKYKKSIDCNNPKGFSQRAHCQGRKKNMNEREKLKGGLSDNMSLGDIAQKHKVDIEELTKEYLKGVKVETEHTKDKQLAKEIAMDHLAEDPKYYSNLKKIETKESTVADAAGGYVASAVGGVIKKKDLYNLKNFKNYSVNEEIEEEIDEATDASSAGGYDVPLFGKTRKGRKNPLSIGGVKTIKSSRAVKDKNFPKYGGPKGIFIKIKEKCKKFPYCNQGDINAIELLEIKKDIQEISNTYGIPYSEMEKIVLNEINKIFINMKFSDINNLIESIVSEEVKKTILSESLDNKNEVYHIKLEGEPIDTFSTEEEAKEALPKYQEKHKGELIIEPGVYESYSDMIDKLDEMGQELEEKQFENMENQQPMEGNEFTEKLLKAREDGEKTFEVDGKEYNVEESWKELEEAEGLEEEEECQECGEKSMEEKLVGNQHKLDKDKDGKLTKKDFKMMQDKNEGDLNEGIPLFLPAIIKGLRDELGREPNDEEVGKEVKKFLSKQHKDAKRDDKKNKEKEVKEGKGMCNECGSMLNEEGMCNECGTMKESTKKKKVLRLTESEMMNLIKKIVSEAVPGVEETKKAQNQSKKDNLSHAKEVGDKLKKANTIEGGSNPEFPLQNKDGIKVARQNDDKENEYVEDFRGGTSLNLDYDNEPSEKFKKRLKMSLEGDALMGNSQEYANVVKSDLGKNLAKQAERKEKKQKEFPMYKKDPQPVKEVNESKEKVSTVLKEEIQKMMRMSSYNKKTQ